MSRIQANFANTVETPHVYRVSDNTLLCGIFTTLLLGETAVLENG